MVAAAVLIERLLDLALQRTLPGFQQSLKNTLGFFEFTAWAVVFPPSVDITARPVFMAQGIRSTESPLLNVATKQGIETLFPRDGAQDKIVNMLAREMSPEPNAQCHVLRRKPDRGGEFFLFCYRPAQARPLSASDVETLGQVGRVLDRSFLALAEAQEHEFQNGLFRIVANLHPEGLCVLDNRLRVVFENRKFKEHMQLWNHGVAGLQNLTLPKQSELPEAWRAACDKSFRAFREVKFPASSGKMVVTQGSLSALRKSFDDYGSLEGDVRYIAFQSTLGVRPFLLLTSGYHRAQSTTNALSLTKIAETLKFSRRETELAELVLRGSSAREIATQLKIAVPTVKTHIRHILHKAGVRTRLQFVGLCRGQG
jgi:DNA-binding CsgD family transcriptional regulator